jgi:preprotein translocase subunit SecG
MAFLTTFLTIILLLVSVILVLLVLMQKTKDGGMGAALGGGATESAFGHETGNVLTKATINFTIAFFVLSLLIYLGQLYVKKHSLDSDLTLPTVTAPTAPGKPDAGILFPHTDAPAPASTTASAPVPAAAPATTTGSTPTPATATGSAPKAN